jgi:hypothetical protein
MATSRDERLARLRAFEPALRERGVAHTALRKALKKLQN